MKLRHWVSVAIAVTAVPTALVAVPAAIGHVTGTPTNAVPVADSDSASPSASASGSGAPTGGVGGGWAYVLTNQESGNSVMVFQREADGDLVRKAVVPTGGLGAGRGHDLEDTNDPVNSQGALIASKDKKFLYAVDAGSHEISVLSIAGDKVEHIERVKSGGMRPVSLTLHDDLLYVANQGGPPPNTEGPKATIAGFRVQSDGTLKAIDGSVTDMPGGSKAGPSQISFSPNGSMLAVTERQTNSIIMFPVDGDGKPGAPVTNKSSGPGPFTATFRGDDILVSSEVVGHEFKFGGLTTYKVNEDGTLTVITGSLNTHELAACWTVDSILDPSILYLGNAQSGTISGIRIDKEGKAELFPDDGHIATTRDQRATQDMAVSGDGRYLYVLTVGFDEKVVDPRLPTRVDGAPFSDKMSISAWRVEERGGLTPLRGYGVADDPPTVVGPGVLADSKGGLPPGSQGIVVF